MLITNYPSKLLKIINWHGLFIQKSDKYTLFTINMQPIFIIIFNSCAKKEQP